MELDSIIKIRDYRDNIRDQIKEVDKVEFESLTYGSEEEYSFKGLIGGLECLLTDLSTLTGAPNRFVKVSTHAERKNIIQYLVQIDNSFDNPNSYLPQFEALKVLLRSYNIRNSSERQIEFEKEIVNTLKIKLQLQDELVAVKKIKDEIEENNKSINEEFEVSNEKLNSINKELDSILERKEELIEHSEKLEVTNSELVTIKENAKERLEKIVESMNESKSNEKLISSFASKVQERETKLSELEQKTTENTSQLVEYEEERKSILSEAKELIKNAKQALNYKTAQGISASFQEHYNTSNNKWILAGWISGAIFCMLGTIGLGIWILLENATDIGLIIGRILLLPLPILGTIFCANQYTKQKNIIEDYAYKMVLSKAIVGFSEQLKKNGTTENEEYIHYIKTALEEIHKDPLRKHDKKEEKVGSNSKLKELVEIAEKIVNISKLDQ
jgi:hypothetical protein